MQRLFVGLGNCALVVLRLRETKYAVVMYQSLAFGDPLYMAPAGHGLRYRTGSQAAPF